MSKEIVLRGVSSDNANSKNFSDREIFLEIKRIGKTLAGKLTALVNIVRDEDFYPGFVLWESDDLILNADDFFISRISFGRDIALDSTFSLSILGMAGREDELFNAWGSDLQVCFRLNDSELKYDEVVFLGLADHRLSSISQFEINQKTQLQIMHIADRAIDIFMRMNLLNG